MRGGVYGRGSGTVLLDDLLCQGEEEDLLHCRTEPGSHTCDHSEDAGVRCEGLCTKTRLISVDILVYIPSPNVRVHVLEQPMVSLLLYLLTQLSVRRMLLDCWLAKGQSISKMVIPGMQNSLMMS